MFEHWPSRPKYRQPQFYEYSVRKEGQYINTPYNNLQPILIEFAKKNRKKKREKNGKFYASKDFSIQK